MEFDNLVKEICKRDPRYQREAYFFLRDALSHSQSSLQVEEEESNEFATCHHITGQDLLEGIREFALDEYGPMAAFMLQEWGIFRCEDFGEIVYNLIDIGLFQKDETDRREHFENGYDFYEAFCKPFLPSRRFQKRFARPLQQSCENI
jgi:uncharacterized repeat protein (TIGR04138 family)